MAMVGHPLMTVSSGNPNLHKVNYNCLRPCVQKENFTITFKNNMLFSSTSTPRSYPIPLKSEVIVKTSGYYEFTGLDNRL